ncbi:hypothetical protein MRX96_054825 [Rhipicephalus microplus]
MNNTLQYITLRVSIWSNERWGHFFRFLSGHDSLKMVTVDVAEGGRCRLSELAKKLEESGCEEKVSFMDSCSNENLSLLDCKNYFELEAFVRAEDKCTVLSLCKELKTYPPLIFLSLVVVDWKAELCWLLVEYLSTTCTLQKMDLDLSRTDSTEYKDWWVALSQSLLRNSSITDLRLGFPWDQEGILCDSFEYVGGAVAQNQTIRKLNLCGLVYSNEIFVRGLSSGISQNYALCSADLGMYQRECHRASWIVVWNTLRRNLGYVARAAQFMNCRRCDTPCAAALDRVYRHPALVAELTKVLSVSGADAVAAVRQRFRSIEGMHEFMRLAGVVKSRVTCQPRGDGRAQLDTLNEDCWAHVRRYLQLDDVRWYCRSSTNSV